MNRLYFGDNLSWLRDRGEFPNESVDLVYLDSPFNSNADYNVLFRETSGQVSQAQFHAFTDTWSWADAAGTYHQFIDTCPNVAVVEMMEAFHSFLKKLTDDGLPRDDGPAPRRAASRLGFDLWLESDKPH